MKLPKGGRIVIGVLASAALVLGACFLLSWRGALAPIEPPAARDFDAARIRRGAQLAAMGGCIACHTVQGGATLAGGRALATPFGTIYSTNITPDPRTGIGRWSAAAFQRAMREGVDREGRHLYPAFPYDHFTLVNDADDAALYAYLMSQRPISARAHRNQLVFPLNIRWILAAWDLWYLRAGPYREDAGHDSQWNHGAYLVNGLGHCGACHTPRTRWGAENPARALAGAEADDWYAYALDSSSQAREPWDAKSLNTYLKYGWHDRHGVAQGPMAEITGSFSNVPDADRSAVAVYLASLMGSPREARSEEDAAKRSNATKADRSAPNDGGLIYAGTCATCHDGARPLPFGGIRLELSTAVTGESALNLINVILNGLHPAEGAAGPIMPGFASTLTDSQLDSLVTYLRVRFADKPAWPGTIERVREARRRAHD